MIPNNWAETANKIVRATVESQLDEYNSVQKFSLPTTPALQPAPFKLYAAPGFKWYALEEHNNYFELDPVPEEDFEAQVLSKSLKAAREIAFTVDYLVRRQAQKYGLQWRYELKRLNAIDLFTKADGNPNLKLHFVRNQSVVYPESPVPGWISYKFLFACG